MLVLEALLFNMIRVNYYFLEDILERMGIIIMIYIFLTALQKIGNKNNKLIF